MDDQIGHPDDEWFQCAPWPAHLQASNGWADAMLSGSAPCPAKATPTARRLDPSPATVPTVTLPTPTTIGRLRAVLTGEVQPCTREGSLSGIDKQPRQGPVQAGPLGLQGDEQGDLRVHGGVDKAVHVYPWSHYAGWRQELPGTWLRSVWPSRVRLARTSAWSPGWRRQTCAWATAGASAPRRCSR